MSEPPDDVKKRVRADVENCRQTRSRAASNVLIVYEYISERELRLIKNLEIQPNKTGELVIGENTIKVDGNNVLINERLGIKNIDTDKLCAKQKEAWDYLTFTANQNGVHPGVIIEKMCVLLASTLPAKLLYFCNTQVKDAKNDQLDMLTAMFNNLGGEGTGSSDGVSSMIVDNTTIDNYIEAEVNRINEAFISIEPQILLEPDPMVYYDMLKPSSKVKRLVPASFNQIKISGVKKITRKPTTEPSNLKKVQINILLKTIDKAIHNLSNLIISATNMMNACLLEYEASKNRKTDFADPVNAITYLKNIPAFEQSLQSGIKDLKDLKYEDLTIFTVEEIKDKICRIKAYMHATLNSYNHQHSVIKFGMGKPSDDYDIDTNQGDAMILALGIGGIVLQDNPASTSTEGGKSRRKSRGHKGGFTGYNELNEGNTQFIFVSPFEYIFSKAEIKNMYNFLLVQILEYTKTSIKHALLIAEIKTCINQLHIWSEIEALYHYDVLNFTFAYTRAQNEFMNENVNQDEDGMFVYLVDDKPSKEPIESLLRLLELQFRQNMRKSSILDFNQRWRSTNPIVPTTTTSGGRVNKFKKRGGNNQLTDEQKHAIDSIARQTGIVDLPGVITQEIAESLGPYYALMMRLAGISVDVATTHDAEIQKVVDALPATHVKFYVYSSETQWTLTELAVKSKKDLEKYLQPMHKAELKTIVSVRFCDANGKNSPGPDPSRYIFKAALDAYVALLGPA
jgi:hypothetical protein